MKNRKIRKELKEIEDILLDLTNIIIKKLDDLDIFDGKELELDDGLRNN